MVTDKVVENLFDGDNSAALAQSISLNLDGSYEKYYIVGVYKYESGSDVSESSDEDDDNGGVHSANDGKGTDTCG